MSPTTRRGKIRPMRRGLAADEVDFEQAWLAIHTAFFDIHSKNLSKLSYEELYRHCYRLVLKKMGAQLYTHVLEFERQWLRDTVRATLYRLVVPCLCAGPDDVGNTSANERRISGELFLQGVQNAWADHNVCMAMLSDVLMYMDRTYCSEQGFPPVYSAAMSMWRDIVLAPTEVSSKPPMLTVLNGVILDQIQMQRRGEVINKHLIKSCISMLDALPSNDNDTVNHRLYETSFEQDFLVQSRDYYRDEAAALLCDATVDAYCQYTKRRLYEEEDRCRSTLAGSTKSKIEAVLEEELIGKRMRELVRMDSGVRFMVDNKQLDELGRVFELISRVDETKADLVHEIQKRVCEVGNELNRIAGSAGQAPDADKDKQAERSANQQTVAALQWVDDVLQLKDKFDTILERSFRNDQRLLTALTRSFTDFINSVTFPRTSEYISLFIDENMKRGIKDKTEHEVDQVLGKAIVLVRFVQDKDLFERYYKKHLCRRLLYRKSVSNDVERQMISRMKVELGNTFTAKLEGMFRDVAVSEELTVGFKTHVAQYGAHDSKRTELEIDVLTTTTWPLDSMSETTPKCIFPAAVERVRRGFEEFYAGKHSGRHLTWLAGLGSADLKANFKTRRHEVNVPTYAMVVLMLFNDLAEGESLSFEEIQARTNIPTADLTRNLQSLAVVPKTRMLVKQPMSKDVRTTDRFSYNADFSGKFFRLRVGLVSTANRVENDRERRATEKKNDDARNFCTEAALVRIMKQRKELAHQQLIAEAIAQLSGQFKPEMNMLKRRIENLIEREYLERVDGATVDSYRYLA